jgi:diacylglycerol kinase (ATP)
LKKNVIMISNPVSGGFDKSVFIEATTVYAAKEDLNLVLYETSGKGDVSKIQILYKSYNPERIIIAGGDGTIKMVAEALEFEDVVFGILPAGSANGLAVELGLMKTLDENLRIAFHNPYVEIDMVIINEKRSLHLSDLGLNAALVKNYKNSAIHGRWGYALQIFNTLMNSNKLFKAAVTANNKTIECVVRMIVIANAKKYGTGVVINPQGIMNDGKFELILLKKLDLIVFSKIVMGNMPVNIEHVEMISTDKATIKTDLPISFQIDGEYYGEETELNISISPEKMKVAVP